MINSGEKKVLLIRSRTIDPGIHKIAHSLVKKGYSVTVLLWDRQNNFKPGSSFPYSIDIFSMRAPYDKFTVLFFFPFWWFYEFVFIIRHSQDIVHCSDLDTLFPALILKFLRRYKLFYIIYDFYGDNIPDGVPRFLKNFVAKIENIGIGFVDVLFLVDEARFSQVQSAKIKKLYYIYNSPPDYIHQSQIGEEKSNELILLYAGVIHKTRGIEFLLKALPHLENVRLRIAGTGPHISLLRNIPESIQSKMEYLGQISYEEVLRNTALADIVIALYDPKIPNSKLASPNKLFEAMMCGKPIIMNREISAAKLVEKYQCGILISYGAEQEFINSVHFLKNHPQIIQTLGNNGRNAYLTHYSWDIMEKRIFNAYETN